MRVCNFLFGLIILSSCNIINPDEEIPSYVYIEGAQLSTDYLNEGTSSSNFYDIWAYQNGDIMGVYEMPVKFPVLNTKEDQYINLYAGIKDNSISTVRVLYPFLNPIEIKLSGREAAIDSILTQDLTFTYRDNTKFFLLEDFDRESISMKSLFQDIKNFEIVKNENEVFEGKGSLKGILNSQNSVFGIQTFNVYTKSDFRQGTDAYIELNYSGDLVLQFGLVVASIDGIKSIIPPFLFLNDSETWKKTYINLGDQLNNLNSEDQFRFYVAAQLPDSLSSANVYLDNLKIISFE